MINFRQYPNCTKIEIPGKIRLSTTNFGALFLNMRNLKNLRIGKPTIDKIETFFDDDNYSGMCESCKWLLSAPACGNNVIHMGCAYQFCEGLKDQPHCGEKVTNMVFAYCGCFNLTGNASCGRSQCN